MCFLHILLVAPVRHTLFRANRRFRRHVTRSVFRVAACCWWRLEADPFDAPSRSIPTHPATGFACLDSTYISASRSAQILSEIAAPNSKRPTQVVHSSKSRRPRHRAHSFGPAARNQGCSSELGLSRSNKSLASQSNRDTKQARAWRQNVTTPHSCGSPSRQARPTPPTTDLALRHFRAPNWKQAGSTSRPFNSSLS